MYIEDNHKGNTYMLTPEELLDIARGIVYQYVGAKVYEIKRKIRAAKRALDKERLKLRPNNEDEDNNFPKFES